MMKKRIFSIFVFAAFLIGGFIYLDKIYRTKERYVNTFEDFKSLAEKTSIDIVFYGSSMSHTAYNPLVINHFTKAISYNLGSDALRIPVSELIFKKSLEYTKPKLIIIEVHESSIKYPKDDNIKGLQLEVLDFVSNTDFDKIKFVKQNYDNNNFLSTMFPLIRNHTKWYDFNLFDFDKRKKVNTSRYFYFGGHYGLVNPIDEVKYYQYVDFENTPIKNNNEKELFTNKEKKNFIKFIERAKNLNIEVIVVTSPYLLARFNNNYFFDSIKKISDSLNVNYINLNNYYKDIGIKIDDFSDRYHLSEKGSIKTSKFLANYINRNYLLEDRSLEDHWKNIDQVYETFIANYGEIANQFFKKKLNFNLTENISIENVKIVKNRNKKDFSIKLNYPDDIKNKLSNYKMGVYVYPKKSDLKKVDAKRRESSRNHDQADVQLKDNMDVVNFRINTRIDNIKEIKLFLYNAKNYNGMIGNPLIINDITFN